MKITQRPYGTLPTGETVFQFVLEKENGFTVKVINYGGIITAIHAPDREGALADVVLGKDSLEDYLEGHPFFGAITGRVAGRIGGGRFELDGEECILQQNEATNTHHGGEEGFDKMLWQAAIIEVSGRETLRLTLTDPDGHNHFPGNLRCTVDYSLDDAESSLRIDYTATCDKSTPLNLTNHSYFNLSGHDSGPVLDHQIQIFADRVAPFDEVGALVGRLDPVRSGYNDFRGPVRLGDLERLDAGNADIYYAHPQGRTDRPKLLATAFEPKSGRFLEVLSTEPGVQFYAGLCLSDRQQEIGKGGCVYPPRSGLALETQDYADSVNFPEMGGAILKAGQIFHSTTLYRFSTKG